ncbi:MAG: phospholipid carrier-dependent glycosyltransferase [Clostridia bacterium]|nr:phospholipid carrier-dependent glycosyltransferase [Clostridia bacterium]
MSALLLLSCLFPFSGTARGEETNLLVNPGFEDVDAQGWPRGWYKEAWFTSEGYTVFDTAEEAHGGSLSASIHNLADNDARFAQTVRVEPNTLYRLDGWILAEDIPDAGWGANLSVEGLYASTEGLFDTDGEWQYVCMWGETDEDQTQVTVYVRLGGYSGESEGLAFFDDLSLTKVDEIPENAIAVPWYRYDDDVYESAVDDAFEDEGPASPAWPYLALISALFPLACILLWPLLRKKDTVTAAEEQKKRDRMPVWLMLGFAASFLLHLFISAKVYGYHVDINCFRAWGATMRQYGPWGFYTNTSFCDYPPAYMLILGVNRLLYELLSPALGPLLGYETLEIVIIKLFPCLCDLCMAILVWQFARHRGTGKTASAILSLLVAFNPVLILNSAAWGQVDSVLALLLMLVVLFAIEGRWILVFPFYVLAVLVKPQALMVGFLGLAGIVLALRGGDRATRRSMGLGLLWALATALVIVVPFSIHQEPGWLIEKYSGTLSSYPHVTVNAANLYYLFSLNWVGIASKAAFWPCLVLALVSLAYGALMFFTLRAKKAKMPLLEPLVMAGFVIFFIACALADVPWTVPGYGAMALAFAIVLPQLMRSQQLKVLPLLGGELFLLLFVLGIKMHERYLFPAMVLFVIALVVHRDWRVMLVFALTCACMFLNEGIVLDNSIRLGSAMGHLNQDTFTLACVVASIQLASLLLMLWAGADLCLNSQAREMPKLRLRVYPSNPKSVRSYQTDAGLHWKKLDTLLVCLVTAVYGTLALWHLGSTKAPQNPWVSTDAQEQVVLDLGEVHENFSMLYFCQVSYSDFLVEVSMDGETWDESYYAEMAQGQCFRWKYLMPSYMSGSDRVYSSANAYNGVEKLTGRYVRITPMQIGLKLNEVIFRDSISEIGEDGAITLRGGSQIDFTVLSRTNAHEDSPLYSPAENLHDEQDTLEGEPCWYNGTYFDEIYHARTAFEHLNGLSPYETTHPPLGKVIMSWSVAIFGMTPFGWRFAGALIGILMVPVMYLIAKQLTKKTSIAVTAAILLSLDHMHYTQTRIATIDSFPVFFILCSFLFMLRFMQRDLAKDKLRSILPDLALSGFFMGCACASKWIGIYAGFGLAVLYFWTLLRHLCLAGEARKLLEAEVSLSEDERETLKKRAAVAPRLVKLCLWCLLFFVLIPIVIYLLSYIPYFSYQHPSDPGMFLRLVWNAQNSMLSYHSTPGLGMDHPFYSPWYEWPVIARPMYYAMAYFMEQGKSMSIFCFGNPAIYLPGIFAFAALLFMLLRHRVYRRMDQRTPWMAHLSSDTWSLDCAFLVIGLMAQFLPWVLVPRGTYMYHYFASTPFLMLIICLCLSRLEDRWPQAKYVRYVYLIVCLIFFVILFPYASGMATDFAWLDFGKKFLKVYYALPSA